MTIIVYFIYREIVVQPPSCVTTNGKVINVGASLDKSPAAAVCINR